MQVSYSTHVVAHHWSWIEYIIRYSPLLCGDAVQRRIVYFAYRVSTLLLSAQVTSTLMVYADQRSASLQTNGYCSNQITSARRRNLW